MSHSLQHGNEPPLNLSKNHYHVLRRVDLMLDQVVTARMSKLTTEAYLRLVSEDLKRVLHSLQ